MVGTAVANEAGEFAVEIRRRGHLFGQRGAEDYRSEYAIIKVGDGAMALSR